MNMQFLENLTKSQLTYSADGIEIMSRPQPFVSRLFLILVAFLTAAMILLSIFGKTDVVVTALGTITSAKAVQKVFTPVGGEVVDIFVNEGATVQQNDVLARIRSRSAIQMAAEAEKKKMELDKTQFELDILWPEKKKLRQQDIETNKAEARTIIGKLAASKKNYNRLPESTKLSYQQHKISLAEAEKEFENHKLTVKEAETTLEKARSDYERYQQLFKITAVSKEDVEEKKNTLDEKKYALKKEINTLKTHENNITKVQLKLNSFLMKVGSNLQKAEDEIKKRQDQLNRKNLEILKIQRQLEDELRALQQRLMTAKIDYETMSKVRFENIDEEQCLKLLAPLSGEITSVAISQIGEMVKPNTPLMAIGPANSEKTLKIKIRNQDRGFIKVGQRTKVKLDAFPYQRYGMIEGILVSISPDVVPDKELGPCYLARVKLASSSILAEGEYHKLNYGMTAKAEIVVRRQRLINYLLDPFKRL